MSGDVGAWGPVWPGRAGHDERPVPVKDYPKDQEHRRLKLSAQIITKIQNHIKEQCLGPDDLLFAIPATTRPFGAEAVD